MTICCASSALFPCRRQANKTRRFSTKITYSQSITNVAPISKAKPCTLAHSNRAPNKQTKIKCANPCKFIEQYCNLAAHMLKYIFPVLRVTSAAAGAIHATFAGGTLYLVPCPLSSPHPMGPLALPSLSPTYPRILRSPPPPSKPQLRPKPLQTLRNLTCH